MTAATKNDGTITGRDITITPSGKDVVVNMNLVLDQLRLSSNHQVFVTPYIESSKSTQSIKLPTYVFSGRNMHYVYLRSGKTKATGKTTYDIAKEMYARKGVSQTVGYTQRIGMEPWMLREDAVLRLSYDTCGCGRAMGSSSVEEPLNLSPLDHMLMAPYPKPVAEKPVITIHHGKARVEFEVDKYELHEDVYSYIHKVTKREHVIDNRAELRIVEDSIEYALSNSHVEVEEISLCGYASPESPFLHNDFLATNRSRALAEFIAKRYHLPQERCTYHAVPENWEGFREMTLASTTITEQQRKDLLELIDRPTYGPSDFDSKEEELINSKKFAALYKEQIHPDWFPKLRYTDFVIKTRLKQLSLEQMREVLYETPELLSLNQLYTIAANSDHKSEDFAKAMEAAIKNHPDDTTANCNAAARAIEQKEYKKAETYLQKAGESDEANILRAIVEVSKLNFDKAREYLLKAKDTPEAHRNLQLLSF